MASLRKLRRRTAAWSRYIGRYRNLTTSASDPWPHYPPGYWRAKGAVDRLVERRFWDETPEIWMGGPDGEAALYADVCGLPCLDCGLPDLHRGQGDGIGSCECPRCEDCGAGPQECGHVAGDDCIGDVVWPVETITVAGGVL